MPVVLTLGEQDVWQCPRCGRGSPDIRDEAAHLDAHRRLERDPTLVTWELLVHRLTRSGRERGNRSRRRASLVLSVLGAVLLGSLLLSVRTGDVRGGRAKETVPAPTIEAAPDNTPTTAARSSSGETLAAPPPPSVPPTNVEAAVPPSSPPAISQPLTAGLTPPTTTPPPPADRDHLVQLCVPSLCLGI